MRSDQEKEKVLAQHNTALLPTHCTGQSDTHTQSSGHVFLKDYYCELPKFGNCVLLYHTLLVWTSKKASILLNVLIKHTKTASTTENILFKNKTK